MEDYIAEREILKESVQRDEDELQRAVEDLKGVIKRPFKIIDHFVATPLPWIFSGLLIGFWLGSTGRNGRRVE